MANLAFYFTRRNARDKAHRFYAEATEISETAFGEETTQESGEGELVLFDGKISDSMRYHASAWMRSDKEETGFPVLYYQELDPNGQQVDWQEIATMFGQTVYDDFVMVQHYFTPKKPGNRCRLYMRYKHPEVESLLIRPDGSHVYLETPAPHQLMFNNFYFENN